MGFRDDPGYIREIRDGLNQLSEQLDRDPAGLQIGTTLDARPPAPNQSKSSAEAVVDSLGQLKEAGLTFCALSLSPMTPEALAWIVEEVAPNAP